MIITGYDDSHWLRLELEEFGTIYKLTVPLPEELAQAIQKGFLSLEEQRHNQQVDRISGRD